MTSSPVASFRVARLAQSIHDTERMKQTIGQRQAAFMPIGEALVYAERCRGEGRLVEAEAVCREILKMRPNVPEA
jgi:hypothetical protein